MPPRVSSWANYMPRHDIGHYGCHEGNAVKCDPFSRIPFETTRYIFMMRCSDSQANTVTVSDEVSIMAVASSLRLVCKHWDAVVGASPELWSHVHVTFSHYASLPPRDQRSPLDPAKLERLLEKSKPYTLRVTTNMSTRSHSKNVWLALLASSYRWKSFTNAYSSVEPSSIPLLLDVPRLQHLYSCTSSTVLAKTLCTASCSTLRSMTCEANACEQVVDQGAPHLLSIRLIHDCYYKPQSSTTSIHSDSITKVTIGMHSRDCPRSVLAGYHQFLDIATFPSLNSLTLHYSHLRSLAEGRDKHATIPRINVMTFVTRSKCTITELELGDPPPRRLTETIELLAFLKTLKTLKIWERRISYVSQDETNSIFKEELMLALKHPVGSEEATILPQLEHIDFSSTQSPTAVALLEHSIPDSFPIGPFITAVLSRRCLRSVKLFLRMWSFDMEMEKCVMEMERKIPTVEVVDRLGLVYRGRADELRSDATGGPEADVLFNSENLTL